ncbi:cytochrome P450 2A13-like [Eublepharis macularius]|uniref:Cytochrome P450 2A13-like n=1 Tax=Eublepharis macularius TaxID=481883 RepID=A0AA97LGT4_EUBMA|nr:cytochrome P450 2A13-like [Eublepharis macularius]
MDLLGAGAIFLIICLSCLMALSTWRQMHGKSKMPPGPIPLPFIGNLLQVNLKDMYRSLLKISDKYGPVYTIHLGPRRIVVLRGYDAVKEALVDQAEEFSGRGEQATFDWLFRGYGVAFSQGERAKQLRRFSITTLRNFGMGKRSIEERILEEAHFLLEALRNTEGAPFDPTYVLSRTVSNVISSITFGNRFDYEDKEFLSLLSMMLGSFRFTATAWGQLYDMFSGPMQYMPGPQQKAFKELSGLEEFITRKVKENQETLDLNSPRDFIDSFLIKMHQEKENPNTEFFLKNLVRTTLNIFFAGTETVSTTLRYTLQILLKYPEIEDKVHEEIDRVIGRNRTPNMDDRLQMPYTEAVIHEIQRYADMLPMGLARRTTCDTHFRGYTIPRGTEVFPLLGSVLRDPKHFARPEAFDPQHFLDENGKFKRNEAFMPFSIGKRYCFGERLARMELFLFFTSILQNFRFKSLIPPEEIDLSPMLVGFATIPRFYDICVIPR